MAWNSHKNPNCYCAFCKTPRRIYSKKGAGILNLFASLVTSLVLMLFVWGEFNPQVIIFFVIFLVISEMFVQYRWRSSIICKTCGFDPVLYVKDPKLACANVKIKLKERKEMPEMLLAKPLKLPTISPEKAKAYEKAGTLISRQV